MVSVVKRIWEPVLIAAAVYFTAGLALAAMPSTAAFAATSMPGITSAASDLGIGAGGAGGIAGSSIASTVAADTSMATSTAGASAGAGALQTVTVAATPLTASSLASAGTAAADAGAAGAGINAVARAAQGVQPVPVAMQPVTPSPITAPGPANFPLIQQVQPPNLSQEVAAVPKVPTPSLLSDAGYYAKEGAKSVWKMPFSDKLLLGSMALKGIAGLASPSPSDIARIDKTFYGSYYGRNADGTGAPAPQNPLASPLGPRNPLIPSVKAATAPGAAPTVSPNPYSPGSAYGSPTPYSQSYVPNVGYMPSSGAAPGATMTPGLGAMPGSAAPVNPAILAAQTSAAPQAYRTPYSPLIPS